MLQAARKIPKPSQKQSALHCISHWGLKQEHRIKCCAVKDTVSILLLLTTSIAVVWKNHRQELAEDTKTMSDGGGLLKEIVTCLRAQDGKRHRDGEEGRSGGCCKRGSITTGCLRKLGLFSFTSMTWSAGHKDTWHGKPCALLPAGHSNHGTTSSVSCSWQHSVELLVPPVSVGMKQMYPEGAAQGWPDIIVPHAVSQPLSMTCMRQSLLALIIGHLSKEPPFVASPDQRLAREERCQALIIHSHSWILS